MPKDYSLYGLAIRSDIAIPEALSIAPILGAVDVTIRRAETLQADETAEPRDVPVVKWKPDGVMAVTFEQVGQYHVSQSEITVFPVAGVTDDVLRLPILGLVISAVLVQRGLPVLHASALKVRGEAVAFIGDKRFGKSTMAATLWARGHQLISDDVVVLDPCESVGWAVRPGPLGIKLWPDAIEALGIEEEAHYPLYEGATKRVVRTQERHATESVPLRRIYVLSRGERVELAAITASDGLRELMRNAFMHRYPEVTPNAPAQLLAKYAPIRRTVDMKLLRRPVDKDRLTEIAEAIETDVSTAPTSAA